MRRLPLILAILSVLFAGTEASAQFYSGGGDPGWMKWSELETPNYRIIYPGRSFESNLYLEYARELEACRPLVGASVGYLPGEIQWGKLPVVLHQAYPFSNGMVAWAPKRMEVYTQPEVYGPLPVPWAKQLAIHESRHVAQMQQAYDGLFKIGNYAVGEMWVGVISALYPGNVLLEGDAVVAETALTEAGRGRNGDFLNYFHLAFDRGDFRDFYQWRYGSFKKYSPDFYRVGYMTVGGMRAFYDRPRFMADYLVESSRRPLALFNLPRQARRASGKDFASTFREIEEGFHAVWKEEDKARAPFMPSERITPETDFATNYYGGVLADGRHYMFKYGNADWKRLIILGEDGSETNLGPFAGTTSRLFHDPVKGRIYWSEAVRDLRWSLGGKSIIRYISTSDHKRHDLTHEGILHNPQPSPDGRAIAAVGYPVEGGSVATIIDTENGETVWSCPGPEGVQLTEAAWYGEDLYFIGIADAGAGLWKLHGKEWSVASAPSPKAMCNLGSGEGFIEYVSDLNGYDELYYFLPESGGTVRMTNLHYGGSDFVLTGKGDIRYSSLTESGWGVFRTPVDSLVPVLVRPEAVHYYPVAEKLAAQEKKLLAAAPKADTTFVTGKPKPYRKLSHLVKFHSWAPVYANTDNIRTLSGDIGYQDASIGATGYFQNELSTASGFVGYGLHRDPYNKDIWKNSFHGNFTYTGLYPVIEAAVDINDRSVLRYHYNETLSGKKTDKKSTVHALDGTSVSGRLSAYIPLERSRGGVYTGFIPKVSLNFSNDRYDTGAISMAPPSSTKLPKNITFFNGYKSGEILGLNSISLSVRGYSIMSRAGSDTYPRYGVGAEAGYIGRLSLGDIFSPEVYTYVYGYLPGFAKAQGLKITALAKWYTNPSAAFMENRINTNPRGIVAKIPGRRFGRVTADYAIPLYSGDISAFSPLAYISHFLLIPHADLSVFGNGNLFSVGYTFSAELSNMLWFTFDGSIGLEVDFYGGSYFKNIKDNNSRFYIGPVFSLDI